MGIITTIPTNLNFPNRGVLERDDFVNAQETAQDLLAGTYTTALNQYATELNDTEADINLKWEQVKSQAVTGGYSQAYIDATFTPKILNTQTEKITPVDADLIPLSDSASSFGLKKLSWANLKATLISSFGILISGLTAKTTPVDADMIVIGDSAATNASKKLTLANLKKYTSPASSETVAGIIELATTAETQDGTDDLRAITPLKLKNSVIGLGQTWQNVTASRALGVTYTNSTGKPIMVSIIGANSGGNGNKGLQLNVDGIVIQDSGVFSTTGNTSVSVIGIVNNGSTYGVSSIGAVGLTLSAYLELR